MNKTLLVMGIFAFFGCGQKDLAPQEAALVQTLGFDLNLIQELKRVTRNELTQLPAIDPETGDVLDVLYQGIHVRVSEKKANAVVDKLKESFRAKGLLLFVFTGEDDTESIAVIKGTDDLDILRYRRTDGINYDLENADIVAKIAKWNEKFGITVIGCGRDWLEVDFEKLPTDLDAFCEEVYEFCPDIVDQGVGELEDLKDMIREEHGIWLWWD